jgi:hypothetical protein
MQKVERTIVVRHQGMRGVPGQGVPAGGTTGQLLVKASNADYDLEYVDRSAEAPVYSVNGEVGDVVLTQDDIGNGTVYRQYSATEQTKLSGIEAGAEVNNLTDLQAAGLTGGSDTVLHKHDTLYYTKTQIDTIVGELEYVDQEYVDGVIAALVDNAPANLNTLNEIAAALGDDPNFAATITALIGTKADITYVDDGLADYLPLTGGTLSGNLTLNANIIITGTVDGRDVSVDGTKLDGIEAGAQVNTVNSLADLGITATAAELNYVDGVTSAIQTQLDAKADTADLDAYLPLTGGTVTGNLGVVGGSLQLDDLATETKTLRILTSGNEVNVDAGGTAMVLRVFDTAAYTGERVKLVLKINEDTSQLVGDWEVSSSLFGAAHHWLGSTADANEARFNDDQVDADFIVKGMTDATMLYGDASTNRIGIGLNAPLDKLHVIGNFRFSDAAPTPTKSMRFRTNGGDIDVEGAGKSIFLSVWSAADYTGTQYNKLVLESGGNNTQAIGNWTFRPSGFGATHHNINGTAGGAAIFNEDGQDSDFRVEGDTLTHMIFVDGTAATENIALIAGAAPAWSAMDGGIFIGNGTAVPTANPTGGGYLYVEAGALKWRGSGGTITTIGPA